MKKWYLIPSVAGPYSRTNPRQPKYVADLQTNWIGNRVGAFFLALVNTTSTKHDKLATYGDVYVVTDSRLDVLVSDLSLAEKSNIQAVLSEVSLPYYVSETVGQLFQRMILCKLMGIPNVAITTQVKNLSIAVNQGVQENIEKWGLDYDGDETIQGMVERCGAALAPVGRWDVGEF